MELKPQSGPQTQFLSSSADIVIFGGSAGSGKTYALLMEMLRHIHVKGFGAVIFRKSYPQIRSEGGLWDTSGLIYPYVGGIPTETHTQWKFKNGNIIKFAHLGLDKEVYDWQGSQIPLICFDELTHFSEKMFFYMLSRNRSVCGIKPYIRATTNPDADSWVEKFINWWIDQDGFPIPSRSGVVRWFIRLNDVLVWADKKEDLTSVHPGSIPKSLTFIPAKLSDNQILEQKDPGYRANLMALGRVERERLLDGNWKVRPSAGMYFRREWFEIVDSAPSGNAVRNWDLAASEPTSSYQDPDWTSGAKLVEAGDTTYITDIRRVRNKPAGVQKLIIHTASVDGNDTKITMEQEPGSGGKITIDLYARLLKGYAFRGIPSTKAKEIRAGPASAAAENGLIKVVRGDWNEAFFDELEAFPEGAHDDQVDSFCGAYNALNLKPMSDATQPFFVGGG